MSTRSILFLDLASNVGWAEGEPGERAVSGSFRCAPPGASLGAKLNGLVQFLGPRLKAFPPARLVYEAPFARGIKTTRQLYSQAGVVEMLCDAYGVPVREADVNTVRKEMLGFSPRGDGIKQTIIAHVRTLSYEPADDDEADALMGWLYSCSVLDPNAAVATTPLFRT